MEALPGKSLTQQEKEKLKEQLAFLKREYSKTFHRLQRAERAERVKNHVKKRTAEQNELLLQKEAEKDPEGSLCQTSPEVSKRVPAIAFLQPSPAKATPVLLGLEPEVVASGDCLPETSGSEWSTPDPESALFCPVEPRPEKRRNRLSRSGAKALRRATAALEERGEAACDVLGEDAGHQQGCETGSVGSSGSPIFKRRSSDQSIPNTPCLATEGGSCAAVLEPHLETPGQNVCCGVSSPLSNTGSYQSRVPSHNPLEGAFAHSEGPAVEKPAAHDAPQRGEQESVQAGKERGWVEEQGGAVGLVEAGRGGAAPLVSGLGTVEEKSSCEETQKLVLDNGETSLSKPGEMGLESQGGTRPPLLEEALPPTPTDSPLGSCTVVEGLLFPVEYYVRTTRQMSRCQREVNLAAVVRGQLGRKRRGQGGSRKERGASLVLPSQEPAGSDGRLGAAPFPPPEACVDPGCEAASSLQSLPPSNAPERGLIQHRRGRRPRGRAGHRAVSGTSPELLAPQDRSGLLSCEAPGWGAALPVGARGSLEARPAESALGWESTRDACATVPATEPAIGSTRGLEVGSDVRPLERRAQAQEGPRSSAGAELVPSDAAPLPQCEPLDADWQSKRGGAAPPGGKGSTLRVESRSHPEPFGFQNETANQKDLPSQPQLQESHVPGDGCGLPEPDEPQACAVEQLETVDSAQSVESPWCAGSAGLEDRLATGENLACVSLADEPPVSPPLRQLHQKKFPSRGLLLSPVLESSGSPLESQLPTLAFPLVGPTPASQLSLDASLLQVKGDQSEPQDGTRWRPEEAAGVGLEESHLSAGQPAEPCKDDPTQIETATEVVAEALRDSQRGRTLQMTSKLQTSSSSCSVDVSAVWWGVPAEFCIAIACEASVSLWRCLDATHWGALHTWHLAEVPVSRIVPLPDVHSLLCVALGGWEVVQIRFLFQSSEAGSPEQSQVKVGDIKAILGLKNQRLVISCGFLPNQTIEVVSFSEAGRSQKRRSLMPPQENVSTFAEVDGMQEALVGLTATRSVVVWNLKTGQLLRRIPVGQPGPPFVCHKAFSDAGLLFVVLSRPHAEGSEAGGTAAFQVIALNPKTARSTGVAALSLPRGTPGRCVEGNVRGNSAAAVLTSGTIAVWDLLQGQCTALLPPSSEGSWSLVRWSVVDDCLLARRTDGSIYLYSYTARLPCP